MQITAQHDHRALCVLSSSSSLLLSSLELSDTEVYAPEIRALFGTASQFGEKRLFSNRELHRTVQLSVYLGEVAGVLQEE